MANWAQGIRVYITPSCYEAVLEHVAGEPEEVGGLLIGSVIDVGSGRQPIVVITQSLESVEYRNSAVSLKMGTEIWSRTDEAFQAGRLVVGWYHSHPNLWAFFSAVDRATQAAFFHHPYSVGWVIDPFREDQKIFMGPDSMEYPYSFVVIEHGLEMA